MDFQNKKKLSLKRLISVQLFSNGDYQNDSDDIYSARDIISSVDEDDDHIPDKEVNDRIVQEISHFKELRKNQYISAIVDDMIPQTNKVKITPMIGQSHVF